MIPRAGRGRARRRREGGVALLVVLWILGLLAAIALILATDARTAVRTSQVAIALARARAAADAGVWLAVRDVAGGDPSPLWRTDGAPRTLRFAGFAVTVSVRDEGGKVDLNFAAPPMLRAALAASGVPAPRASALVREILDWRTPRAEGEALYAGAAGDTYPGRGYGPAHARFVAVGDLLLLPGVSPALFARLRRFVTVYSEDPLIDPRTAPPALLRALPGIDAGALAAYLGGRFGVGAAEPSPVALGAPEELSTQGGARAFTIRARAAGPGAVFVRVAVVVLTPDGVLPYRIARWRPGG